MKNTKIEWADHTFNPWIGCTKVDELCANCYAESWDARYRGGRNWGKGAPREKTVESYWKQPLRWEKEARLVAEYLARYGAIPRRPRVFAGSMCDWLDAEVPLDWLRSLLTLTQTCPHLDWLLLTKRPQLCRPRLEAIMATEGETDHVTAQCIARNWLKGNFPANLWIGTSWSPSRMVELLKIPARVHFLSCEPMLGPVSIAPFQIDWVICGGESGPKARPMDPDWATGLRDQCVPAGVPFFFKQWGEWAPWDFNVKWGDNWDRCNNVHTFGVGEAARVVYRVGKKLAGRSLECREWSQFPEVNPVNPESKEVCA